MDYSSTGAMRSPFSPRMRSSISGRRAIGSAKKNPQTNFLEEEQVGDVIYKTPTLTVETYGAPLPVMVTEALTFGSGEVSVKVSGCGWCWVVAGRRALAWRRDEAGGAARDLTLPQSDLAHKADLLDMVYAEGAALPSVVAVSPEGVVRYWPSVAQEAAYVDVSCELAGQECDRLAASTAPDAHSLVLATTTCTLVLLSPAEKDGRATVTCKTLRPPSGWLGGIGRRVSLLFFGSNTGHADTRLVGVVWWGRESVALVGDGGALGPLLQVWGPRGTTQHALRPLLAAAAPPPLAHPAHPDPPSLEVQALDLQATPDTAGLLLLIAIVNVARSPEHRYAIAHITLEEGGEPAVAGVTPVRLAGAADGEPPRLVVVDARHVLVYTSAFLALVVLGGGGGGAGGGEAEGGVLDVASGGDRVVCAARCGPRPLAFLARHGVVRLVCGGGAGPAAAAPPPAPPADSELALLALDPRELAPHARDARARLQTAFLFHLRRDHAAARALLPAPAPADAADDVDAPLDRSVLAVASDMLDDMPAGDPRWKARSGTTSIALGSSSALQILLQLQDKKRAFTLFLDFLRAVGLWQQMQSVTFEGAVVRTRGALCALAERLAGAIALRTLQHQADHPLVAAAIYQLVQQESEEDMEGAEVGGQLPPEDIWYRRVTRTHRILPALPPADTAPGPALQALAVLNHMLTEMEACRSQWTGADVTSSSLPTPQWLQPLLEFERRVLLGMCTREGGEGGEGGTRGALTEGAARLAELLLRAATALPPPLYRDYRAAALRPFVEVGQRSRGAALAEKFGDFLLLIEMCLDDDDWDRLEHYMDKYADEGFPELAFACAADRGRRAGARLLGSGGAGGRLERWLAAAGAERSALLAARLLHTRERAAAARTLADVARAERRWAGRARAAAALAKLCALAAGAGPPRAVVEEADGVLALCSHRAALPAPLEARAPPAAPLPAARLVQLYVEAAPEDGLTEYDYKKAIDLTHYITDDDERDRLRLQVWCACARADTWEERASDVQAAHLVQHKMFFRLADLITTMGEDLESLIPPLEVMERATALGESPSPASRFLLRTGYSLLNVHNH